MPHLPESSSSHPFVINKLLNPSCPHCISHTWLLSSRRSFILLALRALSAKALWQLLWSKINMSVFFSGGHLNSAITTAFLMLAMNLSLLQYPPYLLHTQAVHICAIFGMLVPAQAAIISVSRKKTFRCLIKSDTVMRTTFVFGWMIGPSPVAHAHFWPPFVLKTLSLCWIKIGCFKNSTFGGDVAACSSLGGGGGKRVSRRIFISSRNSFLWATTSSCSWRSMYAPFLWPVGRSPSWCNHHVAVRLLMVRGRLGGRLLDDNSSLLIHWQNYRATKLGAHFPHSILPNPQGCLKV